MDKSIKALLWASVFWIPAHAQAQAVADQRAPQEPEAAQELSPAAQGMERRDDLGDIVVTARRINERLQDVPASIGVVGEAELESRLIASVSDIKQAVPNLTITKTPVAGGNLLSIRGVVGQGIPNISVDSSIGIYIDGVYLGRPQSAGGAIADIARIEVLRGPQGTLFGRNASGGAINFITGTPAEEFGVQATALYGNYDHIRASASIDTGRFGNFSARFSYLHEEFDGDVRNLSGGQTLTFSSGLGSVTAASELGGRNSDALMAKLRYDDDSGFEAEYKFDWLDQEETAIQGQLFGYSPGQVGQALAILGSFQRPGTFFLSRERLGTINLELANTGTLRSSGHLLTLTKPVSDNTTIKSITSFRRVRNASGQDSDGGAYRSPVPPFPLVSLGSALNSQSQRQLSTELQLLGTYERFNYIFGGFFFRERGDSNVTRFFRPLPTDANGVIQFNPVLDLVSGQRERARNTSYAAYGHAEWEVVDDLKLAGGLRYTRDKRISFDDRSTTVRSEIDFSRVNYDVSAAWTLAPDIQLYARYATGYQSGGIIRQIVFRPEDARSAEIGLKSEFLDRRVLVNLAVFEQRIRDQQLAGFDALAGIFVANVGRVRIRGFEAETVIRPVDSLVLGNNFGYNDPVASTGDRQRAPKFTYSFYADYDLPAFANGMFPSIRVDGDYRSRYFAIGATSPAAERAQPAFPLPPFVTAGFPNEQAFLDDQFRDYRLGGYWLVNGRVSLNDVSLGGSRVRVSGFVRNAFNSRGKFYGVSVGGLLAVFERPRTYGIELSTSF